MSPTFHFDSKWRFVKKLEQPCKVYSGFNDQIINEVYQYLVSERKEHRNTLLVIDDMTREVRQGNKSEYLLDRIIANNRWLNCTIIQSVQKVVHAPPEMRLNFDSLITFYPDNIEELNLVYKTCGFSNRQKFDQLLRYCTSEPYSFLYVRRDGPLTHYFKKFVPLSIKDGQQEIK